MFDRSNLKYFAEYFHKMNMNISCVSTQTTKYNFLFGPKRLKAPTYDWEKYQQERQPLEVLQSYDFEKALGIGLILGYNNLAAIDIDGCVDEEIVYLILEKLGLPKDYSWVVKSGSQAGYHIIYRTKLPPMDYIRKSGNLFRYQKVDNDFGKVDVNAYYPLYKKTLVHNNNQKITIDSNSFCKIEFKWKKHVILPPSMHASSRQYKFLHSIPTKFPIEVDFDALSELQLSLSGNAAVLSCNEGMTTDFSSPLRPDDNNFLIIDVETNGLPINPNQDFTHIDNWPRLIQISWLVCKELRVYNDDYCESLYDLFLLKRELRNITPVNFKLDYNSSLIHGINEEFLGETGEDLKTVLVDFLEVAKNCDGIIGHNIQFDINVIKAEMRRCGINGDEILDKKCFCTMKSSTDLCKIGDFPYKYPTLKEAYRSFFKKDLQIDHNAIYDSFITMKCYNEIEFQNSAERW